jgi:hypothetical protein
LFIHPSLICAPIILAYAKDRRLVFLCQKGLVAGDRQLLAGKRLSADGRFTTQSGELSQELK